MWHVCNSGLQAIFGSVLSYQLVVILHLFVCTRMRTKYTIPICGCIRP